MHPQGGWVVLAPWVIVILAILVCVIEWQWCQRKLRLAANKNFERSSECAAMTTKIQLLEDHVKLSKDALNTSERERKALAKKLADTEKRLKSTQEALGEKQRELDRVSVTLHDVKLTLDAAQEKKVYAIDRKVVPWDDRERLLKVVVHGIAKESVTKYMSQADMYTQAGKLRVPVNRSINAAAIKLEPMVEHDWFAFGRWLARRGVVRKDGTIHISSAGQLEPEWNEFVKTQRESALKDGEYGRKLTVMGFLAEYKARRSEDFTGVYCLYNADRKMAYVGQAKKVLWRVRQHISGNGCVEWYQDYRAGNTMTITLFPLSGSGIASLDQLEQDIIRQYDSYEHGYNKTGGNN